MSQGQQFLKIMYGAQASAYATVATPNLVLPRVQSFNPTNSNGMIYDRGLGEGLNPVATYFGPWSSGGSVSFSVADFTFLQHWIGNKAGAGTAGSHYTLTEATSIAASAAGVGIMQPFTLEANNDYEAADSVDTYVGCVGTSFSLSGSLGGKLECTADFVARHSIAGSTGTTYTASTETSFVMINGTWKWGATPSALSGVRDFTINYSNGLVTDTRSLDSRFMGIPVYGQREYKFSVDIIMASALATTIITNFYGASAGSAPNAGTTSVSPTPDLEFKVELVNGTKNATIWLDQCSIDDISKPQSLGGGLVILTFNGTARSGRGNVPIEWWTA